MQFEIATRRPWTWRFFINKTKTPFGGVYHEFRQFKVYWAYRLHLHEKHCTYADGVGLFGGVIKTKKPWEIVCKDE